MQALMARFRTTPPPHARPGCESSASRDYQQLDRHWLPAASPQPLDGPKGDMVMLDLRAEGNYVAVRPSGTEPKVKFYMFTYEPAEQLRNLEDTKAELAARLDALGRDLTAFADALMRPTKAQLRKIVPVILVAPTMRLLAVRVLRRGQQVEGQ